MELTGDERRILDLSLRRYQRWPYRNHRMIGCIGALLFLVGLVVSVRMVVSAHRRAIEVGCQVECVSPSIPWSSQLPLICGLVLLSHSMLALPMSVIGKLHRELDSVGKGRDTMTLTEPVQPDAAKAPCG